MVLADICLYDNQFYYYYYRITMTFTAIANVTAFALCTIVHVHGDLM